MTIETELKPCPFCGGPASIVADELVGCLKCGCGRRNAASWNTRTSPQPDQETVERRHAVRNILYRGLPVEIDANVCRKLADEILATLNPGIGGEVEKLARRVEGSPARIYSRKDADDAYMQGRADAVAVMRGIEIKNVDLHIRALSTPSEQEADRG
jgi:hypothetical protein